MSTTATITKSTTFPYKKTMEDSYGCVTGVFFKDYLVYMKYISE